MKKIKIFYPILLISITISSFVVYNSTGKAGYTGSPGEATCASCHGGGSGTTSVSISATPAFASNQYTPGVTYTITITVTNSNYNLFGFGCEILDASTNNNAGMMSAPLGGVQFINAFNGRKNATHTSPQSGTGSTSFQFLWVSPSTGTINMYATGNAVNGNGGTTGDMVGSTMLSLTPAPNAISEEQIHSSIQIFPNPASHFAILHINYYNTPQKAKIELIDIKGNKIATLAYTQLEYGENNFHWLIPENISSGIYFIQIYTDKPLLSKSIIIQK